MSLLSKVLITGVTGFRNRGVEALVIPLIQGLQGRDNSTRFKIATCSPEYDKQRLSKFSNVELLLDAYLASGSWTIPVPISISKRIGSRIRSTLGQNSTSIGEQLPSRLLPYDVPDLVVVSGGDIISSDYGAPSLRHVLEPVLWAKAHQIPCALLGQSIGIFTNQEHIDIWARAEKEASLITAREPLSYEYICDTLSSHCKNIHLTADLAFLLRPSQALKHEFLKLKECPTIAIASSSLISQYSARPGTGHIEVWGHLIRRFLDEYGAHVVIIPHVQESYSDDRSVATQIWRTLHFDHRVSIIGADLSAAEYKAIIAGCDMVIAERMHAAIAGFSSGVCTVPVSYSIKAQGITSQLYESTQFSVSDICLPIDSLLSLDRAIPHIDSLWQSRFKHAEILTKQISSIEKLAQDNLSLLCQLVDKCKK